MAKPSNIEPLEWDRIFSDPKTSVAQKKILLEKAMEKVTEVPLFNIEIKEEDTNIAGFPRKLYKGVINFVNGRTSYHEDTRRERLLLTMQTYAQQEAKKIKPRKR
jgi:predicted metal-dependent hydrolase